MNASRCPTWTALWIAAVSGPRLVNPRRLESNAHVQVKTSNTLQVTFLCSQWDWLVLTWSTMSSSNVRVTTAFGATYIRYTCCSSSCSCDNSFSLRSGVRIFVLSSSATEWGPGEAGEVCAFSVVLALTDREVELEHRDGGFALHELNERKQGFLLAKNRRQLNHEVLERRYNTIVGLIISTNTVTETKLFHVIGWKLQNVQIQWFIKIVVWNVNFTKLVYRCVPVYAHVVVLL